MIPILYPPTPSNYRADGIGALSSAIRCEVTEERNGAYTLLMEYPVSGIHYGQLDTDYIIKAQPNEISDPQLFRIYKITCPMDGNVEIQAEHISYKLSDIPVQSFKASGNAQTVLNALLNAAVTPSGFTAQSDIMTSSSTDIEAPAFVRGLLGGQEGSVLDNWGGEYEFDNDNIFLHTHRGQETDVVIEYGKNLTDLKQEKNIDETYTAIMPFAHRLADEKEQYAFIPEKYIVAESASAFSYLRILPVDFSSKFEQSAALSEQRLRELAQQYIKSNNVGVPKVNLTIKFVPLWQTKEYQSVAPLERVNLCDTLTIRFLKLGVEATAKVIKTVYDVLKGRYVSLTLGDAKSTFGKTISSIQHDIVDNGNKVNSIPSLIDQAVNHATDLITGAKGGHALTIRDADGKPQAFAVMDTENVSTAKRMWQWNLNGFGYSRNGINGPYDVAITMDGYIIGKYIIGLTIVGSQIIAGIIQSADNRSWFNLDTGEIHFAKGTISSGNNNELMIDLANGEFNIKHGALAAEVIKTGVIRSRDGTAWINLDTAEVHFEKGSVYAGTLKSGVLSSKDGQTYFNLDTGDLVAKKGSISGNIIKVGIIKSYNENVYFDLENGEICASKLVSLGAGNYTEAKIGAGRYVSGEDFQGLQIFRYASRGSSSPTGGVLLGIHSASAGDGYYGLCDIASLGGLYLRAFANVDDFGPNNEMTIRTIYHKAMEFITGGQIAFYINMQGDAYFHDIYMNGNIIDSDPNIKENIVEKTENVLCKIKKCRVYSYTLKDEETPPVSDTVKKSQSRLKDGPQMPNYTAAPPSKRQRVGVMYDDVPKEIQCQTEAGRRGVDLYGMCSLLWKAVQELSDEIEILKGMITQ